MGTPLQQAARSFRPGWNMLPRFMLFLGLTLLAQATFAGAHLDSAWLGPSGKTLFVRFAKDGTSYAANGTNSYTCLVSQPKGCVDNIQILDLKNAATKNTSC